MLGCFASFIRSLFQTIHRRRVFVMWVENRRVPRGRRRKTLGSLTAGTVRRMVAADAFSWAAGKAGASSRAPNGGALFVNPYCYGTCSACGGGHGVPRPTRPNASDEVG